MKIVFVSPYQAEADLIDHGIHVVRGEPFNVTDTLGATLVKSPLFSPFPITEEKPEHEKSHEPEATAPTEPEPAKE